MWYNGLYPPPGGYAIAIIIRRILPYIAGPHPVYPGAALYVTLPFRSARRYNYGAPPRPCYFDPLSFSFWNTSSMLKDAAFCRCGYSLKLIRNLPI
jgi:hypothetical protein